ncbi:MAG: 30S ribosomal protein S12 methylthiotransferase RimO [Bacteroidales bacterium]|nr:30S ribosomal protein S12 methylthiotransferase RimO [Bacteroidales bacterium]
MKINIITLGCSKNTADSEHLAGHLVKAGFEMLFDSESNNADIVIVNTCGFIGDAKEQSVDALLDQCRKKANFNRRHHKEGRARRLIAVGCLVERYRDELAAEMPEVDSWYGAHQWEKLVADISQTTAPACFETELAQSTPTHYAYLKISEGCDRHCSYCAIPLIRGRHRSRPMDAIVDEARKLTAGGVKELIVIAQDTTYYGLDLYGRRCIAQLMERLASESGAAWIRLHYTYPADFPMELLDVMKRHDNICKYIDMPLQHIDSGILRSMHRGIDEHGTLDLVRRIRQSIPGVCIRTTMIVGYPGETQEAFDRLCQFVREARFDRMGVFKYSAEEGTPAYKQGDPVPDEEKERRLDVIMGIQEQISQEINDSKLERVFKVMIDRREGEMMVGRTEFDSPEVDDEVLVTWSSGRPPKLGEFCNVMITDAFENDLEGEVVG